MVTDILRKVKIIILIISYSPGEEGSESENAVSTAGLEMLRKLFPGKKRSVLELVLRRCNHDLLRAVEHFNATRVSTKIPTSLYFGILYYILRCVNLCFKFRCLDYLVLFPKQNIPLCMNWYLPRYFGSLITT